MTMESTPALELRGVCREFDDFALRDVNFTLPAGCILGMVGENGAGKTTTIRLIMNTLRRDAGEIRVLGQDNTAPAFQALKQDIGVVLDEACFPEMLNARQIGRVMAKIYENWDDALYQSYLERFSLPEKKVFKDYSRGMKMKLAIATALAHRPRLLILDEPTSGLDPVVRDEIVTLFEDFSRDEDHSILISSHITSDLEKLCDYIAFLHKGRLRFFEEKDRLLEEYAIVRCTAEQLSDLPEEAVLGREIGKYGARALVRRTEVASVFTPERPTLEDIILFLSKEDGRV
jgi:ABC-2 type transport system ATP-binding protein